MFHYFLFLRSCARARAAGVVDCAQLAADREREKGRERKKSDREEKERGGREEREALRWCCLQTIADRTTLGSPDLEECEKFTQV